MGLKKKEERLNALSQMLLKKEGKLFFDGVMLIHSINNNSRQKNLYTGCKSCLVHQLECVACYGLFAHRDTAGTRWHETRKKKRIKTGQ